MSGKTKIFVLHMKEVIYTGIFIFLGLIFLVLLAMMFLPPKTAVDSSTMTTEAETSSTSPQEQIMSNYTPGIYTAALEVSGNAMEMQLIIEQSGITDIRFTHLDESIETMYPLFSPVLEDIANQLRNGIALDDITYEESQKYTAGILLDAIREVLENASIYSDIKNYAE